MSIVHVTILGGGWTGLVTAYRLQKAGFQTLVLEKKDEVGGLAKSVCWNGFRFETGPTSFYASEKIVMELMTELMGNTSAFFLPQTSIWLDDRWVSLPLSPLAMLRLPLRKLRYAALEMLSLHLEQSFFALWKRGKKQEPWETKTYFGETLDQILVHNSVQQMWKTPAFSLRPSWLSPTATRRDSVGQLHQFLSDLFKRPVPYKTTFHQPNEGIGSVAKKMREKIEELGGAVRTCVNVNRISSPQGEVRAVSYHDEKGEHWIATDYLFSTIPLSSLCSLLDPLPPHGLIETALQLRYRSLVFLCLHHRRREPFDSKAHYYLPPSASPFYRASFAPPLDPAHDATTACLKLEWLIESDDPLRDASVESLLERALPVLKKTKLIHHRNDILDVFIHREANATPLYDADSAARLRKVQEFLTGIRRIRAIGRQSSFDTSSLSTSVRTGLQAARSIIDETSSSRLHRSS